MKPPSCSGSPDDFQTDPVALEVLFPFLKEGWVVWECAEGKGYLSDRLRRRGFSVVGSDVLSGESFLFWEPDEFDVIVTNPPFSLKDEFLERAFLLGKPFAFLMPLTTLESPRRQRLFSRFELEVVLFDGRVHFESPGGVFSRPWFAVAWFTGFLGIGRQLTFSHLPSWSPSGLCCSGVSGVPPGGRR